MTSAKHMILMLFSVAVVCSVVLSLVYSYTAPRIEETQSQMILDGLQEVISAQEFVEILPDTVWKAVDSAGQVVGIVFRVFPQGYGGAIPVTVGLDLEAKITGVRIASAAEGLKETPGLGVKIIEPAFRSQFIGMTADQVMIKKDGGEIDAITAATISSRAVCNGIKQGIKKYTDILCETIDMRCVVMPGAEQFIEIVKDTLWYALQGTDTLGIVFKATAQGYADRIDFIVGMDKKGITNMEILYSNETAGIGDLICERSFLDDFKNKIPDAITGATVSSRALINAFKIKVESYKKYIK
jgi:electron transport complex protein RnfG